MNLLRNEISSSDFVEIALVPIIHSMQLEESSDILKDKLI
jgi:hypothetical protein